jgi:hypothetical protein
MKAKHAVVIGLLAVVILAIGLVAFVAAGVGGDASNLNSYLNDAVKNHLPLDQVKQKLADSGVQLDSAASPAQLVGTGPHHSAILYSTWLKISVSFNQDLKANAFKIDRASGWL